MNGNCKVLHFVVSGTRCSGRGILICLLIMFVTLWTIGSVLAVSVVSLVGVFLLSLREQVLRSILLSLVAFATGAMLSNVFVHLLPEIVEGSADVSFSFLLVFLGVLLSLVIEKFIHWHHCHDLECVDHRHTVGTMVLIGDAAHNITDGILIATSYLVDVRLGIASTIAVMLHELPQEIGDFSILLHSGYSRLQALRWNFVSALTAILGALAVLFLRGQVEGLEQILLPLTAGNFLYIAGSDLVPELHKESKLPKITVQFLCLLLGALLIYALSTGTDPHGTLENEERAFLITNP